MITTAPLRVRAAATVVCIRRAQANAPAAPLFREEATRGESAWEGSDSDGSARLALVFGQSNAATLGGWETLLGQSEVQNWVRSSPDKDEPMRYPGEWKFAGGVVEPGETPEEAARRELEEEFHIQLPKGPNECKFHLLSVRQTRPIRNVSNVMYNFVAAAEENAWLEDLDVAATNAALARRRECHRAALEDGSYWLLSKEEREAIAPEIREVQWQDMRTAILHSFSSMNATLAPVNAFQAEEFARLGIVRRDPMFLTMATLLEVESFPSVSSLARYSSSLCPDAQLRRIQWLTDGMLPEEVQRAIRGSTDRREGMFRTAEERLSLRAAREQEDAAMLPGPAALAECRL